MVDEMVDEILDGGQGDPIVSESTHVDTPIESDFVPEYIDNSENDTSDGNDHSKIPDEEFDEEGNWLNPHKDDKDDDIEETVIETTIVPDKDTPVIPVANPKTYEEFLTHFPVREEEEIDKAYESSVQEGVNAFITMANTFLPKAKHPIILQEDGTQAYAQYTAQDVLEYCMKNTDEEGNTNYDLFLELLSPTEVRNFIRQQDAIDNKYNTMFDNFSLEKKVKGEYKKLSSEKEADTTKWNDYIKPFEKENPAIAHVLKTLRKTAGFDKNTLDMLTTAIKEGQALQGNAKIMSKQTDSIKKQMMGTIPVSTTKLNEYSQYRTINDVPDDVFDDPIKYKKMVAEFSRRKR